MAGRLLGSTQCVGTLRLQSSSVSGWPATGSRTATRSALTATRRSCASSKARGLHRSVRLLEPREATYEELLVFHTARYVDFVRERSQTGQGFLDGGDTPAYRGVYEAAATVVGAEHHGQAMPS